MKQTSFKTICGRLRRHAETTKKHRNPNAYGGPYRPQCVIEAENLTKLLDSVDLLREALNYERKAFEQDTEVNGADLVEFFGEWRQRVEKTLKEAS